MSRPVTFMIEVQAERVGGKPVVADEVRQALMDEFDGYTIYVPSDEADDAQFTLAVFDVRTKTHLDRKV
ncbi:hypothetical protein ACIA8H_12845 [Streptomyces goshikiensis]|uniref:hypothetical protein n=1 Tax=Streptomyces goshikiensis TaxID=1942 RepID=UPI0037A9B11E